MRLRRDLLTNFLIEYRPYETQVVSNVQTRIEKAELFRMLKFVFNFFPLVEIFWLKCYDLKLTLELSKIITQAMLVIKSVSNSVRKLYEVYPELVNREVNFICGLHNNIKKM